MALVSHRSFHRANRLEDSSATDAVDWLSADKVDGRSERANNNVATTTLRASRCVLLIWYADLVDRLLFAQMEYVERESVLI